MKTFGDKLNDAMGDQDANDVIPVLTATLAMLGVYTKAEPNMFSNYVLSVIRDAYEKNVTPPKKELN